MSLKVVPMEAIVVGVKQDVVMMAINNKLTIREDRVLTKGLSDMVYDNGSTWRWWI